MKKTKDSASDISSDIEKISNQSIFPPLHLGIDIDGCVDEATDFFRNITHNWPSKVFVISFRDDVAKAEAFLAKYGIRYHKLILVNSFAEKAKVIAENGIGVYFDDQPEVLKHIPENVAVMLVRNGGNYDFELKKWLFSKETGKLL